MSELYDRISILIKEITYLETCRRVAIYPLNDAGLIAKSVLENCYGYSPIIVDDEWEKYNKNIISVEQYKQFADLNDVILICVQDPVQNQECAKKIKQTCAEVTIKNILSLPIAYHPEKKDYFKALKKLLLVQKAVGFELKRYGRHHDGGYVMLDDFRECHIAYSFGINDDISWDEQIAENGIDVFCYDHTINTLPKENPRLHFNKIGIGVRDSLGESLLSLDTILALNQCQNDKKMILKMDTEGAEWGVIRDISSETLSKFAQITFEFHNVASLYFLDYEETLAIFEKLNRTHQVIWIHANNFGTVEQAGDILMPDTLEITYANRNYYQFQPCEYSCPLSIDEPNHSLRPDVELDNFGTKNMESEISNNIQKEFKFYEIDRDNKGMDIGCEAKINNQYSIVIRLSDKLNEQESVIDNQNNKLNEQRSVIDDQNNKLNEQRSVIENQNTKLDEQHSVIEYQNAKLKEQSNIIENQYSEIQTRENRISVLTVETREKSDTIDALRQQLEQTKNELDSLYNSRSWKITTPLRKIFTFFRKVFKREK